MNTSKIILQKYFKNLTAVKQLLLINVAVFGIVSFIRLFAYFFNASQAVDELINYGYVPGEIRALIFRLWTPLTYQFMHTSFMHILFNMMLFYFMGNILNDLLGAKKVWIVYVFGGISAAFIFIISFNVFPVFVINKTMGLLVGASGSVMAITAAAATLAPNYIIMLFGAFRLQLKWLALALILIDIAGIPSGNPGGGIAHLGGALFGMLYILFVQGKINNPFSTFLDRLNRFTLRGASFKNGSKSYAKTKQRDGSVAKRNKRPNQGEIDAILDKISNSGYDSLTKAEKEVLFKASE